MILHAVYLSLREDHSSDELAEVMVGLMELGEVMEGFRSFSHGPNIDVEGKSKEFAYGFHCGFADRAALDGYAQDPRHRALGGRLVALCKGGADGIMVFDLESETK